MKTLKKEKQQEDKDKAEARIAEWEERTKKYDFEADAYMIKGGLNPIHLASTGQRVQMGDSVSSGPGKFD